MSCITILIDYIKDMRDAHVMIFRSIFISNRFHNINLINIKVLEFMEVVNSTVYLI